MTNVSPNMIGGFIVAFLLMVLCTSLGTAIWYFYSESMDRKKTIADIQSMNDVEFRRYVIQKIVERGYEVIGDQENNEPGTQFVSSVDYFGNVRDLYKPIYFREYK